MKRALGFWPGGVRCASSVCWIAERVLPKWLLNSANRGSSPTAALRKMAASCLKSCSTTVSGRWFCRHWAPSRSSTAPSHKTARGAPYRSASSRDTAAMSSRFHAVPGRTVRRRISSCRSVSPGGGNCEARTPSTTSAFSGPI